MSIESMYTAVSSLQAHQQYLSVVANNLANVDTIGFKDSRVLFSDAISQTLQQPTASSGLNPGGNGAQIGLGVGLSSITPLFTQGSLMSTGVPTDLAISGKGFFVVKDPTVAPAATYYTRAGALNLQNSSVAGIQGYLVTPTGQRVQGAVITAPATAAANGAALSDVSIPTTAGGPPALNVTDYNIDSSGRVNLLLSDGSNVPWMQIGLQNFQNPEALLKVGQNLYQSSLASGALFTGGGTDVFQTPGTAGTGNLRSGYLEQSNVDLGTEFSNMIQAERGLQASARVITTSDEVMQELINLKH